MHRLVAVDDTEALAATLARAAEGAPRASLAAALADDEITETEAFRYIDELIASQILVADLECAVTGPEPLPRLLEALDAHPAARESANILAAVASELDRIDAEGAGVLPERYEAILERLQGLDVKIEAARLLQVDLGTTRPRRVTRRRRRARNRGRGRRAAPGVPGDARRGTGPAGRGIRRAV